MLCYFITFFVIFYFKDEAILLLHLFKVGLSLDQVTMEWYCIRADFEF